MSLPTTFAWGQATAWRRYGVVTVVALVAAIALVCGHARSPDQPSSSVATVAPGGQGRSPNAYGHAVATLVHGHWTDLREGKAIFLTTWVAPGGAAAQRAVRGPSSQVREGLGPQFNATSCTACHFRDGRGGPPRDGGPSQAMEDARPATPRLLRLGLLGPDGQLIAEPTYGVQLQDHALPPLAPEGTFEVELDPVEGRYPDGTRFVLQAPQVTIRGLRDGSLLPQARVSVRSPPALIGLGLLEAVGEQTLAALADPDDTDGDGISGRLNHVRDPRTGARVLGRFGWKASQPSLWLQNATALREDLGVTTSVFPDAAGPELGNADLERLTRYTRLLGPPARRGVNDARVARGEVLFASAGCAACHRPRLETGDVADLPELARQTIEPYSDLLLHDMGEGLADHRPEGEASGLEWRTAPLWGLGQLGIVSGDVRLLHDGRAGSPEEAILWHGGEAAAARDRFARLPRADRAALLRFLDAL